MKHTTKGRWMRLQSSETLRALMRQKEFSFERLARYAGCSKSFISHLLAGRKKTCTPQLAERIAEALDVPVGVIFLEGQSTNTNHSVNVRKGAA